ncbi:GyrI-like domain-containing protein [Winogradskyella arenosi]|uniref:AraC family transcriptional regulator n=1 Tax=Winogradskyella arenosi TaxID=533325 RepID=A0A368ZCE9_9FLAO|nr:GyrI-like domain-containing protein [Winogradskyella arenosi]RCW90723.1 AraC family transcriptional regulator [Winogradskyella arenosi]
MRPEIIETSERKVIGVSTTMRHGEYHKIQELWQQFMPRLKAVKARSSMELIALQEFPEGTNTATLSDYIIWACAEVLNFNEIPEGMMSLVIPAGTYAVVAHKGMDASKTYRQFMSEWLINSGYGVDTRPHFQVMGAKYKNGSPDSEEEFYIPIKRITEVN